MNETRSVHHDSCWDSYTKAGRALMDNHDRRTFLRNIGGATLAASFPESIGRALAIPAHHNKGSIEDVEHIVILMQENRSFDHYFGSLRGVRGFNDPRPVQLPSGKSVWYQPDGNGYVLPFHPTAPGLGLQFLEDLPHGWTDTHAAWNGGKYDAWIANKSQTTMAYLRRQDIPFHYALADAFTVCDAYYCSLMGPTDPNRYHMWTGWVGNDGAGGGPVISNAEAGYDWSTYPEILQAAGKTWKIYQDSGVGLDGPGFWGWTEDPYIGNYGDNSLLYFHQYQNAAPGQPLYDRARTGTNIAKGGTLFDILQNDVRRNALPQVSWIVAPEALSEHGNWPANYGAWYVSKVLDALTSNRQVWSKTALFITYDENDGFFDHLVPPTPPQSRAQGLSTVSTVNEIYPGSPGNPSGPYGLGVRVPMLVVSPWSKGGFVCSEVFDHTSIIRFIEQRFGLKSPNITPWRRAVCGDLTSAFDFANPNADRVGLPKTFSFAPSDSERHPDYSPVPPVNQKLPKQEPGLRHARALPYELQASGYADSNGGFRIDFANTGKAGACFQVRSGSVAEGPWTYTVEAGKALFDVWTPPAAAQGKYDLSVYGPNGFLRGFQGNLSSRSANLGVDCRYRREGPWLDLNVKNLGPAPALVRISDKYTGQSAVRLLPPGAVFQSSWSLKITSGWYDLIITADSDHGFARRLAGHVETGDVSITDPFIGLDV
jgi:phospholipase C